MLLWSLLRGYKCKHAMPHIQIDPFRDALDRLVEEGEIIQSNIPEKLGPLTPGPKGLRSEHAN